MTRILIVDDERLERNGVKFLIEKFQWKLDIYEAENGRKALEAIRSHPPDILMTDIRMPHMDGLQLAEQARELCPDIKIIILSAFGEFDYAKKAIGLHVMEYILKPVEVDEFFRVMTDVIAACGREEHGRTREAALRHGDQQGSRFDKEDLPEQDHSRTHIDDVIRIIHEEYMTDITLEDLAAKVYLSPSYLSHIFKKQTGVSIVKYITSCRLNKAKEMLLESHMKIVDICKFVGYSNLSYFSGLFRNHFGKTPSEFRERK